MFDLSQSFEQSANQLLIYLGNQGYVLDEDKSNIYELVKVVGENNDVNIGLRSYSTLKSQFLWYHLKYKDLLSEAQRSYRKNYNKHFIGYREKGYSEWPAKSMAESHSDCASLVDHIGKAECFVQYLSDIIKLCEERLRALESISHNMRSEMRNA